jgi:hypothetical protein
MDQDATKNCPYCGEEVLAVAIKCKHCGEFLDDRPIPESTQISGQPAQPAQKVVVKAKEGCFLQTLNIGCVIIVIGIVAFVVIIMIASQ